MKIYRTRQAAWKAAEELGPQFSGSLLYRSWIFFGTVRAITLTRSGCADASLRDLQRVAAELRAQEAATTVAVRSSRYRSSP